MNSKKRSDCSKYIRTTMIGAIAEIEHVFGKFWAFGKEPEDRTEKQEIIYDMFMDLRERILDLGNEQIKKMKENERHD